MPTVIVFGPTGNIGSVAAQTAQAKGAQVWLAMRDTQKPIPGLSAAQEQAGNFHRVQADLTQPETVAAAVATSGATHAFLYLALGSPDHMQATAEALKASGIELVVFLSSFTVGDHAALRDVPPSEVIPYVHARVEMVLDEVFGAEGYVAVRPGGFATNMLRFKAGMLGGRVEMFGPGYRMDLITPGDIGRVSGTVLAEGLPRDGQRKVYLYGPQVLAQREAVAVVGEVVMGREIAVVGITAEQALREYEGHGIPKPVAEYMVARLADDSVKEGEDGRAFYDEGVENVRKYTGKLAMGFREWVEENQALFQ